MKRAVDPNVVGLFALGLWMLLLLFCRVVWAESPSASVKTVYLSEETVVAIPVTPRGIVLNFPMKPSKVLLGRQGAFTLEYVETDLALSPSSASARSYLYVYLQGRRFSFDLVSVPNGNTAIINVRDTKEKQIAPKVTYGR